VEPWIEIGRVTRAHALAGELRVEPHWAGSESLFEVEEVRLERDGRPPVLARVESARPNNKAVLLKLAGIDDRTAAEALRGARVWIERSRLPESDSGEFYLCDLIGARVYAPDGEVGAVVEVRLHPSVDCLVIRTPDGTLVEQPLAEPWLEHVDVDAKRVELSTRDGLIS
jgi:16S rRNA processing protein RimM